MKARFYQENALKNLDTNIEGGKRDNLVVIPVGGGKSVVIAHNALAAIKRQPEGRVILLAHRGELSTQNAEKIRACDGEISIGFEKADQKCAPENQIMVASVQTIGKKGIERVRAWCDPAKIVAIMIDEAHHIPGGKTYQVLLEELRAANPNIIVTGFTATPKRGDGERIDAYIKHIAYEITMQELVEAKYLARLKGIKVKTKTSMKDFMGDRRKDFDEGELAKLVNNAERNQLALDVYRTKHLGEHGLVFCVSKAHAEEVGALFVAAGIKATVVTEDTPKKIREGIKADLASGKTDVLISVGVLTEGFDVPTIKVLLMLRPTKSPVLYEQILGRGLRLVAYPDPNDPEAEWLIDWERKSFCTVYDFVDQQAEKAGAYNLAKMVGLNPEFDLKGEDIFEVKTKLEGECQGEPLLQVALQECRSLDEINALLESHDILTEIRSIHYAPNQELGWMEMGKDETWIQLARGEIAQVKRNALGGFVLELPQIDLATRYAERQTWEEANPGRFTTPAEEPETGLLGEETIELEGETLSAALKESSKLIKERLPLDAPLLKTGADWREKAKETPATEAQKKQIGWLKLDLSEEELENLNKADASDLITKAKLQKTLMETEGRITFGKYKGASAHLVNIYDRKYLAWMVRERADFLRSANMLRAFTEALEKNPIPWLKKAKPGLYKKDFDGMEEFYEKAFVKDPEDVYKTVRFALDQDPANTWPATRARAEEFGKGARR